MQRLDHARSAYRRTISAIEQFTRMSRPNSARENIEFLPKIRGLISEHEYAAMAELFENKVHKPFDGVDL
jgi:hypothetical protein